MKLTKKSIEILKSFKVSSNIQSVADKNNLSYNIIRNNFFKPFWRKGLLNRINKGFYQISKVGLTKIEIVESEHEKDEFIIYQLINGISYEELVNELKKKYNNFVSYASLYAKSTRIRKKKKINDRREAPYIIPEIFSSDLAELLGLLYSDGYVNKKKVCFYNKDKAMLSRFYELTENIFLLTNIQVRLKSSGVFEISYNSVHVASYLCNLMQIKKVLPEKILRGTPKIKNAFLKGIFSGDGCITYSISNKKIFNKHRIDNFLYLACKREKITHQINELLVSLGYTPNIVANGLRIGNFKDIVRFYYEIGFISGSKISAHSKPWRGFEKNELLKYAAINSKIDNALNDIRSKNKEEIVLHIQSTIKNM